jgi:hypothetical protein
VAEKYYHEGRKEAEDSQLPDVLAFVVEYKEDGLFDNTAGRQHNAFPRFT